MGKVHMPPYASQVKSTGYRVELSEEVWELNSYVISPIKPYQP